jgi:hypothetical protein
MKNLHRLIKDNGDSGACPFLNLRAQSNEQSFNVTPLDRSKRGTAEDAFNRPAMLLLNGVMVSYFDT